MDILSALGRGALAGLHGLVVLGLCAVFGSLLAGDAGMAVGVMLGAVGVWNYRRQPEPTDRERLRAWALNVSPYAGALEFAFAYGIAFAIYGGIGALLGLAFGSPLVGGIAGCGFALWIGQRESEPPCQIDHGNVHGSAEFAQTLEQVREAGLSAEYTGGLFVGVWREIREIKGWFGRMRREVTDHWLSFRGETSGLVFAPPGSGKGTSSAILTALANTEDSKGIVDPKGQIAAVSVPWLIRSGHRVALFAPTRMHRALFEAYGCPFARCNPLGAIDIDDPNAEAAIAEIMAIPLPLRTEEKSSYFSGEAQSLGTQMALHLRETIGSAATLPMVAEALHLPEPELNRLFAAFQSSRFRSVRACGKKYHIPIDEDGKPLRGWTTATRDVIATAQRETAFLLSGEIAAMFDAAGTDAFDFATMKREKCAVFVLVPEGESESVNKSTHLLLACMKNSLLRPGGGRVLLLVDELCTALPESATGLMQTLYSFARGFGVKVVGYAQSWPQFVAWAGSESKANALRASAGCTIFYGANDPETCAYVRQQAGSYTVWTPNSAVLPDLEKGSGPMGVDLLRDEDLRDLHRRGGQVIFLLGSRRVVVMPRTSYRDIPDLAARAAPDPFHL